MSLKSPNPDAPRDLDQLTTIAFLRGRNAHLLDEHGRRNAFDHFVAYLDRTYPRLTAYEQVTSRAAFLKAVRA